MKHAVFFLLLFLCNICEAQFPDYYVYLVKGVVNVTNKKGKHQVKQGEFLYKTDVLNFIDKAEITLSNRDADYFVLNGSSNLKLSTLQTKDSKSYSGITKKYLDLVWDEVLNPNYDLTKFKNKNLTDVYGGVSRGDACKNLVFPINGLKSSEDTLNFKWLKTSPANNYNFIIYDGSGKEILHQNITDTQNTLNISQQQLSVGKYYWLIKSNDATCEDEVPLYFEILNKDDENKFINSITANDESLTLNEELDIIDKLEKNAFIYAAKEHFAAAIKNDPQNEALTKMYVIFLLNYGFDNEAALVWNANKKS